MFAPPLVRIPFFGVEEGDHCFGQEHFKEWF